MLLRPCLAALITAVLLVGCQPEARTPDLPTFPIAWQPVAVTSAELPASIQVFEGRNDTLPLRAWYVRIDGDDPSLRTDVVVSDDVDRRETTASFAADLEACVVVNGGYFTMNQDPADHVGSLMVDGAVVAGWPGGVERDSITYEAPRAALLLGAAAPEIGWVASRNDTLYRFADVPAHRPGAPAVLDFRTAAPVDAEDVLAAGPALIHDGTIRITSDEEVFFGTSIPDVHPRTAAGITADGDLLLVVVDGRQDVSRGVDLQELALLLRSLGAVEALNLDGGGSSTLVVGDSLLNRPTGGTFQREVMSALATTCP